MIYDFCSSTFHACNRHKVFFGGERPLVGIVCVVAMIHELNWKKTARKRTGPFLERNSTTYYVGGKQGIELGTFTEQQTKSNGGKGDRVTEFLIAFLSSIYRAQSIRMSLSILEQHLAYTVQISSAFKQKIPDDYYTYLF